jgi:hypothetical protein
VAMITAMGASLATFSVAHQEADTNPQNDSVGVLTVGTAVDSAMIGDYQVWVRTSAVRTSTDDGSPGR